MSTGGSSKSQYGALDLHVARSSSTTNNSITNSTGPATAARKADDGVLSARNILIRRKLMERKRFDSADHAMRQQSQSASVGASVLFNALGGGSDGDENVDMDDTTVAADRGHAMAQKKHFDSADYQLAQFRTQATTGPGSVPAASDATDASGASPMEIDLAPATDPSSSAVSAAAAAPASINSPSAASVAARSRVDAPMSPSVRGGLSGANVLLMRKLSEKKRFDSADYQMQAGPAAARASARAGSRQPQPTGSGQRAGGGPSFYVAAASPNSSLPAPPPAPAVVAAPVSAVPSGGGGGSKYGKLSAANVLIRKKLKERKRFDSADYAMERQGQEPHAGGNQGGAVGALRGGHVVTGPAGGEEEAPAPEENKSISHQVKHIKLSEAAGGGWATRVPSATASVATSASSTATGAAMAKLGAGGYGSLSHDTRLAARNLIIQRKLSERKRFDSADYFKEAAARGHTG
ncbi:hypothetical protein PybrP1_011197 [[Pythium] brassicae (nom. inval.)]|nr:hypothetical protein PybrP1_011197 [[Pythium] brassicae (nom. inval.)]